MQLMSLSLGTPDVPQIHHQVFLKHCYYFPLAFTYLNINFQNTYFIDILLLFSGIGVKGEVGDKSGRALSMTIFGYKKYQLCQVHKLWKQQNNLHVVVRSALPSHTYYGRCHILRMKMML